MGYDVSAHPVDVELIQGRLLAYVRGEGDVSDLVADAVRHSQVRFRANAWGLGVIDLRTRELDAARKRKRKLKRAQKADPDGRAPAAKKRARLVPRAFDPHLHVWGRPYFITVPSDQVSAALDRYQSATPLTVDAVAADMLAALNPKLVGKVQPDEDGTIAGPEALAEGLVAGLNLFREAYPSLRAGKKVKLPAGDLADPKDLFLYNLPLEVLTFASHLWPGWMGRGYVWFTAFIARAGLDAGPLVESAADLFEPLLKDIRGFHKEFHATITENYTLGGYVRPKNVPAFREWWEANSEAMMAASLAEGWDEPGTRLDVQKITEAVRDAERRGGGFAEASEVYSGIEGVVN